LKKKATEIKGEYRCIVDRKAKQIVMSNIQSSIDIEKDYLFLGAKWIWIADQGIADP